MYAYHSGSECVSVTNRHGIRSLLLYRDSKTSADSLHSGKMEALMTTLCKGVDQYDGTPRVLN